MMYRFIDEATVERARNPIRVGDRVISNPTEATLRKLVYKDMETEPMPECGDEEYAVPHYTDGDQIRCHWSVEVIEDEPV